MDFILSSNQSSVILSSLASQETVDLSYEVAPSYPILAKSVREIQPVSSTAVTSGGEIVFNLNKSMLLRDMQIRSVVTTTTTSLDSTANLGFNLYEKIELRTNNKVIMTMSDAYIWARTQQCSEAKQTATFRRSLPMVPTTEIPGGDTTTGAVCYTNVYSSFFESVQNAFDLNFYEQLSLLCKVNTAIRGGFNGTISGVTATLWVWAYRLDDKAYDMLRAKNQSPSRPLTMLAYNTYTEVQACTSTTQNIMRLNVNFPVFNTYIMIKSNTAALKGVQFRIDSMELSMGGTKLIEACPYLVANWESCAVGGASSQQVTSITNAAYDDSKCIAINWGMEPWNRVSNTGAVSFAQINYPQITLNHQTLTTAASWSIYVIHEYWNVLSLDAASGSVNIALSS